MISVGIDIGAYSIKVAEVEAPSKSYVIRRVQEFPLSLDLTKDKKIEIIDTLRTLF
jgi:Tfp pilus assembly PilM family ATPase